MKRPLVMACAAIAALVSAQAGAAILYSTPSSTYSQNFDSLPNTPTNATLGDSPAGWVDDSASPAAGNFSISGWYLYHPLPQAEGGSSGNQRVRNGTGSANTGSFWSFGGSGSTDRALGSVAANTLANAPPATQSTTMYIGARFTNATGATLDSFTHQRLTTWMAALTVMIGSLGVPVSTQRAVRSGEAFPCQDCACGCSDAATCWRDCCCYTNAQKVVWAEKNGVKVPLFVTVAARREQASMTAAPACCSSDAASDSCDASCSAAANEPCTTPSCCQKRSQSSSDSTGKTVLLMNALKCRGISVSVGWLPPSLPPALPALDAAVVDLGPLHAEPASLYRSPCDDVATPPPDACQLS